MGNPEVTTIIGPDVLVNRALTLVAAERNRQHELKANGRFRYTPSDHDLTNVARLAMLSEEIGEVARECLSLAGLVSDGNHSGRALRKELVQVAAIAVAWIEILP